MIGNIMPSSFIATLKRLSIPSIMIWLVPFIVSLFFYNADGDLISGYWTFKGVMILVSFVASFVILTSHYKKTPSDWRHSSIAIVLWNILFDLIFLIGLFAQPIVDYLLTTVTVYIVLMPLSNWLATQYAESRAEA